MIRIQIKKSNTSKYKTKNPLNTIIALNVLKELAPNFCKYAARIHVFRMEEWSDVTERLTGHKSQSLKIINSNEISKKAE